MELKVYVVQEGEGGKVICVKLTFAAAHAVAKLKGGRRVVRCIADKVPELTHIAEQH